MTKEFMSSPSFDNDHSSRLASDLNCPEIFARISFRRGLNSADEVKQFFLPSWEDLHDPFLMKDMHMAVETLFDTIEAGQKILVYGDYDVEGTSAVALVVS